MAKTKTKKVKPGATNNRLEKCFRDGDKATAVICYTNSDKSYANWLFDKLEQDRRSPWMDSDSSPVTAEWIAQVYKEIEQADCFIFVVSPESIGSEDVKWALDHALANAKRVIPVVARDVPHSEVREDVRALQWVWFKEDSDDWDNPFNELLEIMDKDLRHVRFHTFLLTQAIRWELDEFEKTMLLSGPDLEASKQWLTAASLGTSPQPTTLHMSFINNSAKFQDTMAKRRIIALFFLIILVISITSPSWGVFFFALIFSHIFVFFSSK